MKNREIEIMVEQNDENGFVATVWSGTECICTITNELYANYSKSEIFAQLKAWGIQGDEEAEKCYQAMAGYYGK